MVTSAALPLVLHGSSNVPLQKAFWLGNRTCVGYKGAPLVKTVKRFLEGLGSYLFTWWSFVFTVLAAIVALVLAKEHWYIQVLVVVANALGCGAYAYARFCSETQAKAGHQVERDRHVGECQSLNQKLQDAERKLNEVPLGILSNLSRLIESGMFANLGRTLVECAKVMARHKEFLRLESKPLPLKTFVRRGDQLYAVVAKASPDALNHLRVGDPFVLLVTKDPSGVESIVARLQVHQLQNLKPGGAVFTILVPIPSELEPLATLAIQGDVSGLKGYSVKPGYDILYAARIGTFSKVWNL
jgi:hypothetical protein